MHAVTLLLSCACALRWSSTTAAAKKAYGLRYRLLTYLYSSMHLAHKQGGTLARPIFFSDPSDLKARSVRTTRWLIGSCMG
jgi:alpha-glucosidase (family GH31 glycosyl hydrolase)